MRMTPSLRSEVRALDDVAETDIALPVPALQLHLAQRMVIGGAGVDADARQQRRHLEVPEVVRLAHDAFAGKIALALFEQDPQHRGYRVGIGVERLLRIALAVIF